MIQLRQPQFSALICHWNGRRNPLQKNPDYPDKPNPRVRVFKYELTNNTVAHPLGMVVCPESGVDGSLCKKIEALCQKLPTLAALPKEDFLEKVRFVIRAASSKWNIGENEHLGKSRGKELLMNSTADVHTNDDGTISVMMDWEGDPSEISVKR